MEIELKFKLENNIDIDGIFNDFRIFEISDLESEEKISMCASYFDTQDKRLSREGMAFRVRAENERLVATLKWNDSSEEGLHIREEINIPLEDKKYLSKPSLEIFSQSNMYETLKNVIGSSVLVLMMQMDFIRRAVRLDNGNSIFELSVDKGVIRRGNKTKPISELEIELFSGTREELDELGEYLSKKFELSPEKHSKFRQGLDIIDEE